jgi:hypothetical protein
MTIGNRLKQDVVIERDGRVIRLRPRVGGPLTDHRTKAPIGYLDSCHSPVPDLAEYECPVDDDDFGHRMVVSLVALAFISLMVLAGLQLVTVMTHG